MQPNLPSLIYLSPPEEKELAETVKTELKKYGYEYAEDSILSALTDRQSRVVMYWAILGLCSLGSKKALPILKELVEYPFRDVQAMAVRGIATIEKGKSTAFLTSLLTNIKFKDKYYAIWALWEVGDETALGEIKKYAASILSGKRKIDWGQEESDYIVDYLKRYGKDADSQSIIAALETMAVEERRVKLQDTLIGKIIELAFPFVFRKKHKK